MEDKENILIVEDDLELAGLVCDYLSNYMYQVHHIANGLDAVEYMKTNKPDLVLLDLMLPGLNGMEVCKNIRQTYDGAVVMLTGSHDGVDEILGLEIGADDYLTKPVEPRRLVAKIKALLRRMTINNTDESSQNELKPLMLGSLKIFESARVVQQGDRDIELTAPEFDLLLYLAKRNGVIVSRDEVFLALKGFSYDGVNRSIDILISYLRAKLDDSSLIRTIRGKGYLFLTNEQQSVSDMRNNVQTTATRFGSDHPAGTSITSISKTG